MKQYSNLTFISSYKYNIWYAAKRIVSLITSFINRFYSYPLRRGQSSPVSLPLGAVVGLKFSTENENQLFGESVTGLELGSTENPQGIHPLSVAAVPTT